MIRRIIMRINIINVWHIYIQKVKNNLTTLVFGIAYLE